MKLSANDLTLIRNHSLKEESYEKAYLYDIRHYQTKREFQADKKKHFAPTSFYDNGSRYGSLIRNAKMFNNHIPYGGKLRFFEVNL